MRISLKILLTVAGLLLCLVALEKLFDFALKQNANLKTVTQGVKNANLLVHGPCEPLWMISPAQLDSVTQIRSYNLALSHSDFADNYLHLYLYLQKQRAPQSMLLYVTPESMDPRFNTFNTYRFAPFLSDSVIREAVKENDPEYFRWTWFPFMRYAFYNRKIVFAAIQGLKHYAAGRTTPYYPDGFEPPARRVFGTHGGAFVQLYDDSVVFRWDTMRARYLQKTIRLAKAHGIDVLLYESPVLEEALAWQGNRQEILLKLDSLAAAENVRYVRFENMELAKHRDLYISTLNFNLRGLRLFNDTLGKFLLNCR